MAENVSASVPRVSKKCWLYDINLSSRGEDKDKSHVEANALGLSEGRCLARFHYV